MHIFDYFLMSFLKNIYLCNRSPFYFIVYDYEIYFALNK